MPNPLPATPRTITAIVLLAMSSGLLDAAVYIEHGQVFANAMTGNMVLLGVSLLSRHSADIVRHLVPLLGFAVGVTTGKYLLGHHRSASVSAALLLQIFALITAGLFARFLPSNILVAALSTTGAIIITVIRRTGDVSFNITFMTGNFRAVLEGAFDAAFPSLTKPYSAGARRQFLIVGVTCTGFLLGAALGAYTTHTLHERSFWVSALLLCVARLLLSRTDTATGV